MAPALTAEQLAIYRSKPSWAEARLYLDRPPIVFAAQVDLPSGALYPVTSVVTKNPSAGSIANVEEGMLVAFGTSPGKSDLGRTVIKGTSGGAVLLLPRTSNGKVDGTIDLLNNTYLVVLDHFPPWSWVPYIDPSTGVTKKYSDWDYATYGLKLLPICNIGWGCVYADQVDGSDVITLSVDTSGSFSPEGVAISSRLHDIKDGTYISGSSTSTAFTASFPVGRRWITSQVTDANGKTQKRRLLVVACKDGTAFEAITRFRLSGPLRQAVEGQSLSFEIFQDIPESEYVDGCAICYFVHEVYGEAEATLNSSVVKFSGWHHTESARVEARRTHLRRSTTIEALDTAGKLASLPAFPQVVENVASGAALWEQRTNANADNYLASLWLYHSNAAWLADFIWSGVGASYPFTRLGSNGGTLWEQMDGRAKAIGGYYRLLGDALGRVKVKIDPLTQEIADRTATNTIDLSEDDWVSLGWTGQRPARNHWLDGSAILAHASIVDATFVIAPGLTPGQGLGENSIGEMLVINQTKLSQVSGQAFLRENAPQSYFKIRLLHGGDASYEPLDFVRLTMSAETAAQRGLTFTNERFLIVEVETEFDNETGAQTKLLTLERETKGNAAFPLAPPPTDTGYTEPGLYFGTDLTVVPAAATPGDLVFAATFTHLGYTQNWTAGSPTYTAIPLPAGATAVRYVWLDPYSPRFQGTGLTVRAWLLTDNGLWYTSNLLSGSAVWTLKQSISPATGVIRPSTTVPGLVYVSFSTGTGNFTVQKLSAYGATIDWTYLPTAGNNVYGGMDIDHYGSDECLVAYRNTAGAFTGRVIARIVNGAATILRPNTDLNADAYFIQKPLKTFSGAENRSIGAGEAFIWSANPSENVIKTANGGTTYPNVAPTPFGYLSNFISSVCFTEDSNVMAIIDGSGRLYVSTDGGTNWTLRATDAALHSLTIGFWPTRVNGEIVLYFGGASQVGYSPDFGISRVNKNGTWATDVGAIGSGFISAIPIA